MLVSNFLSLQLRNELENESQKVFDLRGLVQQRSRSSSVIPQDEQLENVRQQLMNAQMHITDLEITKSKYQQMINDKEEEIRRMEKQFAESIAERDDTHAALRAQLDLYKADYEAEASAKNSLLAEKNQIAEDLQNLQRRNQQLIEEVDRLRRDGGDFVHVPRPRRNAEPSSSTTDVSDDCFLS